MAINKPKRSVSYSRREDNKDITAGQDEWWVERAGWVIVAAFFVAAFLGAFS